MVYVQRDNVGNVCGVYGCPQPQLDGSCLTDPTPLPDTHPDVVAFQQAQQAKLVQRQPAASDILSALIKKGVLAQADITSVMTSTKTGV